MNAIVFLTKEHDKVRATLAEIAANSHQPAAQKVLFEDLCQDIIEHEMMEQQIWYPHFKHHEKLDATVKHLVKEEKVAENIIKLFSQVKNQAEWDDMFAKFKKDVEHHADEEEKKLFPIVQKILDETQLKKIGNEMREFKKEFNCAEVA